MPDPGWAWALCVQGRDTVWQLESGGLGCRGLSCLFLQIPQTLQSCQPSWTWTRATRPCSSALWTVVPWLSYPCSMGSASWPPAWDPSSHPTVGSGPRPLPTPCSWRSKNWHLGTLDTTTVRLQIFWDQPTPHSFSRFEVSVCPLMMVDPDTRATWSDVRLHLCCEFCTETRVLPGVVAHTYDPSTQQAEAGGLPTSSRAAWAM